MPKKNLPSLPTYTIYRFFHNSLDLSTLRLEAAKFTFNHDPAHRSSITLHDEQCKPDGISQGINHLVERKRQNVHRRRLLSGNKMRSSGQQTLRPTEHTLSLKDLYTCIFLNYKRIHIMGRRDILCVGDYTLKRVYTYVYKLRPCVRKSA